MVDKAESGRLSARGRDRLVRGLGEEVDNRCRKAAELAERWNNRAKMGPGNLAESYIHGEIEFDARVSINNRNWRARFKAITEPEDLDRANNSCSANADGIGHAPDEDRLSVFALLAEPIEGIKKVVPSLVWFHRSDDVAVFGCQLGDFLLRPLFEETSLRIGNGEADIAWFFGPVLFRESRDQEIKALALRGENCSDLNGNFGRQALNGLKFQNCAPTIWVRLMDNAVGLSIEEDGQLGVEDYDLIVRSFEFGSWRV
jgi:hypothetical protein